MNLYNFIPFFMICLSNATTYPGKRWIIICNNSKKMRILVSQRMDFLSSRREYRDSIDQELISWLVNKNYFPISLLFLHFSLNSNTNFPFALTSHDSRIQQYNLPIQLKLKLNFVL